MFSSYLLRFSERIYRMRENSCGNFFIQSQLRNDLLTRGKSVSSIILRSSNIWTFIYSLVIRNELSKWFSQQFATCQRSRCWWHLFNLPAFTEVCRVSVTSLLPVFSQISYKPDTGESRTQPWKTKAKEDDFWITFSKELFLISTLVYSSTFQRNVWWVYQ